MAAQPPFLRASVSERVLQLARKRERTCKLCYPVNPVSHRWIRFLLAVVAILAASAAAYRVVQDEQQLSNTINASRKAHDATETALTTVDDLKAALHAYVAPGQGLPFWSARAVLLLDKLRGSLLEVDKAVVAAGGSIGESLDVVDRLAAAEQRARDHMRNEQPLLAGDVIFNEARDLLDSLRMHIARGRDHIARASSARETELKREQVTLVAGAVGILALVMLLLVPTGRAPLAPHAPDAPLAPSTPHAARASASARTETQASYGETSPKRPAIERREGGPHAPRSVDPSALAAICAELAAVRDSNEIEPILDRARDVLQARGVIVWLSSPDRMELHSAVASGYDARVVARLGPIHRETGNLTANAFRENGSRTSAATGTTAAALAVPLPSPDGPAGVFALELSAGTDVDDNKLAAARVIAAQLGALLGSIPGAQDVASGAPAARSSS